MRKRGGLDADALALLRVLYHGEIRGLRQLSEQAAGRCLRQGQDVETLARHAAVVRDLIGAGYVRSIPENGSLRLSLSRRGAKVLRPGWSPRQRRLGWAFGSSVLAAGVMGCAPMPMAQYQPSALLMGEPMISGLEQVRDPVTGAEYFMPCNPCMVPTPKTPIAPMPAQADGYGRENPPQIQPMRSSDSSLARQVQPDSAPAVLPRAQDESEPTGKAAKAATTISYTVFFDSSSIRLDDESIREIEALLPLAHQAASIRIKGRTDATGRAAENRSLALARASRVRSALIAHGVDARKLKVFYCTRCHVSENDTEQGRRANRRVEIDILMPSRRIR